VHLVESRNWTMTVLWRPPGGPIKQTPLSSNSYLFTQDGTVNTISVP
jgi:hypothetical protein